MTYLAYDLFANSIWFPLITSALGAAVMYAGVKYNHNKDMLHAWLVGPITKSGALQQLAPTNFVSLVESSTAIQAKASSILEQVGSNNSIVQMAIIGT